MRIALGADHAGYLLKDRLREALERWGHTVSDLGTNSADSVDYPDFARRVGTAVAAGEADRGVLVCGTGIGMAISANKVRGVRAACCNNQFNARLARAQTTPTSSPSALAKWPPSTPRRSSRSSSPPSSRAGAISVAS